MQPIFVEGVTAGVPSSPIFNNRLNAYMDQCWDGAYTCQFREQRFPTFLDMSRDYKINFTGSPPKKQRFELFSKNTGLGKGALFSIPYPDAGAFKVYDKD
jgi:hypothetical protein